MRLGSIPLILTALLFSMAAVAQQTPVVTDSRIKALVYNENDVYSLLTHYGYQANIEFGPKERIETVSVGDRIGWQIIPAGRRLFIRPLEEGGHTNMTVITNLHSYQFDLLSDQGGPLKPVEAMVYVVRFYYPGDDLKNLPQTYAGQMPVTGPGLSDAAGGPAPAMMATDGYNYRYTFTGPDPYAPQKVYDDGQSTYLELSALPSSATMVAADGKEVPVSLESVGGGVSRIPLTARRFVLHYGTEMICIYNEAY